MQATQQLRQKFQSQWDIATDHAFCKELADGTLPIEKMKWYLAQDYQFIDRFVRLLATAIAHAPSLADSVPAAQFLAVITGPENTYFLRSFDALEMTDDERNLAAAPETTAFQNLMYEAHTSGRYEQMLAVLVVAEWTYLSWAERYENYDENLPFWFSEWIDLHCGEGIIYLALVFHGAYGLIKRKTDQSWDRGRLHLLISLVIGAIWLPVAFVSPIWATILIWAMLITALMSLYQTRGATPKWAASWPVALYAGWLTAASFVSIGLILAGYGFMGEVPAAIIGLVLATPFAVFNISKLKHWTYGAAISWGVIAIAANNWDSNSMLAWLSVAIAVIVIGTTVLQVRRTS